MTEILHHITDSKIHNQDDRLIPRSGRSLTDFSIILDLDATLICTFHGGDGKPISNRGPDGIIEHLGSDHGYSFTIEDATGQDRIYGAIRPHAIEFLDFCNRYFKNVIVYTAGSYEYGHGITSALFSRTRESYSPDYIMTRPECLILDDPGFPLKGVRKPLALTIPDYDPQRYVLIDDRMSNIRFNPRNGIVIPPFDPNIKSEVFEDTCLIRLKDWFNQRKIILLDDIRDAEKMLIFDEEYDLEQDYF